MDPKAHWEQVYRRNRPTEVSWYQPHAGRSLALIRRLSPPPGGAIIDVGGGASTLVDGLLDAGYQHLTVNDVAAAALTEARTRLGSREARVRWMEADILEASLPAAHYHVWHDRAVFHFLTDPRDRRRYVAQASRALRLGGHVVVATFADDGPTRCSGLDVNRYSSEALRAEFGAGFRLESSEREEHVTPAGIRQAFVYAVLRVELVVAANARPSRAPA